MIPMKIAKEWSKVLKLRIMKESMMCVEAPVHSFFLDRRPVCTSDKYLLLKRFFFARWQNGPLDMAALENYPDPNSYYSPTLGAAPAIGISFEGAYRTFASN